MDIAADVAAHTLAEAQARKLTEAATVNEDVAKVTGSSDVGALVRQWVDRLEALDDVIRRAAARIARVDQLRLRVSGAIERQLVAAEQRAEAERRGFALSLAEERLLDAQSTAEASEAAAADAEVQLARTGVFLELQALFDELGVEMAGSRPTAMHSPTHHVQAACRGAGGARDGGSSRSSSTPKRPLLSRWSAPWRAPSPVPLLGGKATPGTPARQV